MDVEITHHFDAYSTSETIKLWMSDGLNLKLYKLHRT